MMWYYINMLIYKQKEKKNQCVIWSLNQAIIVSIDNLIRIKTFKASWCSTLSTTNCCTFLVYKNMIKYINI